DAEQQRLPALSTERRHGGQKRPRSDRLQRRQQQAAGAARSDLQVLPQSLRTRDAADFQPSAFAGASDGARPAAPRANHRSCASVPSAIATMKTTTGVDSDARFAIAGP